MVGRRERYRSVLVALSDEQIPGYLNEHSGLPGPRSDLELLAAFGDVGSERLIRLLVDSDDEYLRCCGTAALGRLLIEHPDDSGLRELLTARAADPLWRVREGVAMAAQRVGDADPSALLSLVRGWVAGDDPLVVRAAIAGICEPRLLRDTSMTATALETCRAATDFLTRLPVERRRDPDVRTLRQALGYCWSVAVAADPAAGLPAFLALSESDDPDVAWVVCENRKKKRIAQYLS